VNNTGGGFNSSSVSFGVDTVNPAITIQSPTAINYTTTNISLSYTVSDANLDKCWYKLNAGANTTLTSCANTTFIAAQGSNTITVYVNDTVNNFNSSSVTFFVDSINPAITIQSPTATNYTTTNISLNYVASDANRDSCWYKLNAGANTTLTSCTNTTFIAAQGSNTITVYVNDTINNFNSSSVTFFVDSINPAITIQSPANITYASTSVDLNYTASDTNRDKCWYKLDSGSNTSLTSCANITLTSLAQGSHTIYVYVNDTVNNFNSSSLSFGVDTIPPSLAVQSPIQGTTYNATNTSLKYTVSDAVSGVNKCWYSLNGGANTSLASCANTTFIALLGSNTVILYSNDSMNNINSSTITFTVNSTIAITIQSPQAIIYNYTTIDLNYTVQGLNIDSCWYGQSHNFIFGVNSTIGGCANISITGFEGSNQVTVYTNNTLNNITSASVSFTIDTINPQISVQSPTATDYTTNNISLNYIASDTNRDKCWYNLNAGPNIALATCSNTTFTASQGSNTVVVHVNDTANNKNSSSITFTVDSLPPILSISSPLAQYYPNNAVSLIYTVSDSGSGVDKCWYILDGNPAVQLSGCANASLTSLAQGSHTIVLHSNDTWGNTNSTTVVFGVNFMPPVVSISSPQNINYPTLTVPLTIAVSFSVNSLTPDSCWYTLDGGSDVPLPGCANTTVAFTNGPHTLVIYANDTFSRSASNFVNFAVVNGSVSVLITSPTATTYHTLNINLNYIISCPYGTCVCTYDLDGVSANLSGCANTTVSVLNGNHTIIVNISDANTSSSDSVTFTIYTSIPGPTTMFNTIETEISTMFMNVLGSPILVGLAILVMFGGLVLIARLRDDARIMILTPAIFLALAFLPGWLTSTLGILIGGSILALGLIRVFNR
jgi:hypothetical protein